MADPVKCDNPTPEQISKVAEVLRKKHCDAQGVPPEHPTVQAFDWMGLAKIVIQVLPEILALLKP